MRPLLVVALLLCPSLTACARVGFAPPAIVSSSGPGDVDVDVERDAGVDDDAGVEDGGVVVVDGGVDAGCGSGASYDEAVLCEGPVAYWAMRGEGDTEADLSGHQHPGTYVGGTPARAVLPNGDVAAAFDGARQFLSVPSSAAFSIPTTGELTWEAWLRPDVLQFENASGGYVDVMGKCAEYSPTCEWEARLYNTTNPEGRCNRLSAYVFNPSAGLGSAADWQPTCGLLQAGQWLHVVATYTLLAQPADCANAARFPGSIDIWVNGVKWSHAHHGQTGCMSQFSVVPQANDSPLLIGTMARDAWFQGAIAKVALYDHALTDAQIAAHHQKMTTRAPTGSCAGTCRF